MTIRTKILCLMGLMVVLFFCGLAILRAWDQKLWDATASARLRQKSEVFKAFLARWDESQANFVTYAGRSSEMSAGVAKGDRGAVERILNDELMERTRIDAVWILGKDGAVLSTRGGATEGAAGEMPGPKGSLPTLLKAAGEGIHFYSKTPAGLISIDGHAIREDSQAGSPIVGYLFAGRWLHPDDLTEMSRFSGDSVVLARSNTVDPGMIRSARGKMVFAYPLPGWDGRPAAHLVVRTSEALLNAHERSANRLVLMPALFGLAVFFLTAVALRHWVTSPMRLLGNSLRSENPNLLRKLEKDESEMGALARMIRAFFVQRASLRDETQDRRQSEEALLRNEEHLRHSQKMEAVGQLAGGIAHDFNNVLTAVMGYSELLRKHLVGDRIGARHAAAIYQAAEQAAGLTRRLMAFSRKQSLHTRPLDLNQIVANASGHLREVLGDQIELRVKTEAAGALVRADLGQMEQVLLNLAMNARDAMPKGGIFTLSTEITVLASEVAMGTEMLPPGRYVALIAADTGHGMRRDIMEHVFEPFFTTKKPQQGAGLGLAMVYGIVKQNGGAISIESTPGMGACFTIHLPALPPDALVETAESSEPAIPRTRSAILVVEEDRIVREMVNDALMSSGYEVYAAASPAEALELMSAVQRPVGLLVSEIELNKGDFIKNLKDLNPAMKVLLISGYAVESPEPIDQQHGAVDVLDKPFAPHELLDRIRGLLEPSRASLV